jgi:hypothetical protein
MKWYTPLLTLILYSIYFGLLACVLWGIYTVWPKYQFLESDGIIIRANRVTGSYSITTISDGKYLHFDRHGKLKNPQ